MTSLRPAASTSRRRSSVRASVSLRPHDRSERRAAFERDEDPVDEPLDRADAGPARQLTERRVDGATAPDVRHDAGHLLGERAAHGAGRSFEGDHGRRSCRDPEGEQVRQQGQLALDVPLARTDVASEPEVASEPARGAAGGAENDRSGGG